MMGLYTADCSICRGIRRLTGEKGGWKTLSISHTCAECLNILAVWRVTFSWLVQAAAVMMHEYCTCDSHILRWQSVLFNSAALQEQHSSEGEDGEEQQAASCAVEMCTDLQESRVQWQNMLLQKKRDRRQ